MHRGTFAFYTLVTRGAADGSRIVFDELARFLTASSWRLQGA
jgi:hypothetical protein